VGEGFTALVRPAFILHSQLAQFKTDAAEVPLGCNDLQCKTIARNAVALRERNFWPLIHLEARYEQNIPAKIIRCSGIACFM